MADKVKKIIISFNQVPIDFLQTIRHHRQLISGAIYFAFEFLHSETEFVNNYFEYMYSEELNLEDTLPSVYYNEELFTIELLQFHEHFREFVNSLIGHIPKRVDMLFDMDSRYYTLLEITL